jgi:hypothetical protein
VAGRGYDTLLIWALTSRNNAHMDSIEEIVEV